VSAGRGPRWLSLAVLGTLVLLIAVATFLDAGEGEGRGSVGSNGPDGRRALRLTLERLGFPVDGWEHPPGALPRGANALWMARIPRWDEPDDEEPGAEEPRDEDAAPPRRGRPRIGLQSPEHYLHFVESGGSLILPYSAETPAFLQEVLELDGLAALTAAAASAERSEWPVRLASGEVLRVRWSAGGELPQLLTDGSAAPLWMSPDPVSGADRVLAATIALGSGRVVLLADDAFVSNAELIELDHALLATRLVEGLGPIEQLLFDEYALGHWAPDSALSLAFSGRALVPTLQLLAWALLALWCAGWAWRFPRDPEPLARLAPLSRARAQANVLERAGRFALLAGFAREAALHRLRRLAGLVGGARVPAAGSSAAALEQELDFVLERLGLAAERATWRVLFVARRVATQEQLNRLQLELDALVERTREQLAARRSAVHA